VRERLRRFVREVATGRLRETGVRIEKRIIAPPVELLLCLWFTVRIFWQVVSL